MTQIADTCEHCPRCKSTNLIRQTGQNEPTCHYGRLKCGDCEKFITWLKDPSTSITTIQRQATIKRLLGEYRHEVNNWEIGFLQNVYEKRYLTPKQKEVLNRIGIKVLGVQICMNEETEIEKRKDIKIPLSKKQKPS